MANFISIETLFDGSYSTILKIDIVGDGSGEFTDSVIYDPSIYTNKGTYKRLIRVHYQFTGFSTFLEWDGTPNKQLITMAADHHEDEDYTWEDGIGGLSNINVTDKTGQVLLTTVGLDDGYRGHLILFLKHKD